ncbi:hypothetical protein TIFTF001_037658 [Ficus carica]|uniref:Uncharacterized protein n=1 Tax=Ficus carica TaxID=3494 RepID=A0AA88JCT4_FICCA|nr:hypothetical protein TIFTF001_037658 [Ficus carica]
MVQFASTTSTVELRKDPAGEYWRTVMNDQAMPEAIHALLDDFEPTPNASAYPDGDAKAAESAFVKAKTYFWELYCWF